jgi:LysM repeat protein
VALVQAQQDEPDGPVYIVQEGDSLWDIAVRFRLSLDDLAQANGISDPNQIAVGDQLVIPGLEGVQGILVTRQVPYGENLRSLSRKYAIAMDKLAQLNHVTSPEELYAGYTLVIPEQSGGGGLPVAPMNPVGLAALGAAKPYAALSMVYPAHPCNPGTPPSSPAEGWPRRRESSSHLRSPPPLQGKASVLLITGRSRWKVSMPVELFQSGEIATWRCKAPCPRACPCS